MKFATTVGQLHKEPLCGEHFRQIRDAGFDAIELTVYPGHFEGTDEEVRRVKRLLKEYGLHVESVHGSFSVIGGEKLREAEPILRANMELLADLGGKCLVVHYSIFADPDNLLHLDDGRPAPGFSVDRDLKKGPAMLERIQAGMASYAEYAKKLGVVFALETDLRNNHRLLEFISVADESACGICFDTGHAQVDSDAAAMAKFLGPRVVCTHLHDNDGKEDRHWVPFMGVIDWEGVFAGLKAGGYAGAMTYEGLHGTFEDLSALNGRIEGMWEMA